MEAPFFIGQRVVALTNSERGYRKKGNHYDVLDIRKCVKCGKFAIDIGQRQVGKSLCKCGVIWERDNIWWHLAEHFAPIQEQRIRIERVAVSETLWTKAIEIAAVETN